LISITVPVSATTTLVVLTIVVGAVVVGTVRMIVAILIIPTTLLLLALPLYFLLALNLSLPQNLSLSPVRILILCLVVPDITKCQEQQKSRIAPQYFLMLFDFHLQ
jgi:hypothetical protein